MLTIIPTAAAPAALPVGLPREQANAPESLPTLATRQYRVSATTSQWVLLGVLTEISGIESGQESGVIGNTGPVFGPATKEYYDEASWAVVPTTANTEYIPDVPLPYRSRNPDMPAFIRPLPNDNYLPALLTIVHSIPLFRNTLLAPKITQENYWLGDEWWKGSATGPARTVDSTSDRGTSLELDIIYESQRLMAALDKTDRAYVCVNNLLQLDAWKESQAQPDDPADDLLRFLLTWSSACEKQMPDLQLNGFLRSSINAGGQRQSSFLLDANVVHYGTNPDLNLYDVLDQELFSTASGNAHIMDISNVLMLRLTTSKTDASRLDCKIPATFYADRYLEENKEVMNEMFLEIKGCEDELTEIERKVEQLKYHKPRKIAHLEKVETLKLLQSSMRAFKTEDDAMIEDPKDAAVFAQLKSLHESIECKLLSESCA